MLSLALPLASGAKPVSSAIARKSYKERPSAREGGLASSPACMKDFSALDIVEAMVVLVQDASKLTFDQIRPGGF
jgi:hypothetical protein